MTMLSAPSHMHFDITPDFKHKRDEPRYFVRSLDEQDSRYTDGYRFQIQFLNEDGQGEACIEFRPDDSDFSAFPLSVPSGVISAARSGINDYVDADGCCRQPGFLGGGKLDKPSGWFG